jgi:tetrahydromethanopterin S-methyltransferase subunit B
MKIILTILLLILISFGTTLQVFAVTFEVSTDTKVYTDGKPLFVYGNALPNENLIIRLFAPDGTIAKFDQVKVNEEGLFNHVILTWPDSSTTFPYGTYTVEVISSTQNGISKIIDVKFTSTTELMDVPVERRVNTLVFAPETAAVNQPFRIFVQTTSDGLLVGGNPQELLETSHVHLPNDDLQSLTTSFNTLHPGLYFVDYTPTVEGNYVFHIVTFSLGTISHGSAATNVLTQDIEGISNQIFKLNSILDETSNELDKLKSEIEGFDTRLEKASSSIDSSVSAVSSSVSNIEEASIQLNSLFFPIVASIGIIVALQIVILARRR